MADPFLGQDLYEEVPTAAPQGGSDAYHDPLYGVLNSVNRMDAASVSLLLILTLGGVWALHAIGFRAVVGVGR